MCPIKPKRPCSYPNCSELTDERYCDKHKKTVNIEYSRNNRPFKYLYNTSRWKKSRRLFLQEHPLCEECKTSGVVKAATVVDHVEAHKGNEELFWNQSNWQALCKECHDRKTAKEDGRWGKKGRVYTY
jgi:5-methylcytosine-specific restriction enzyme A